MAEWCDTSDPEAKEPATPLHNHFKQWCEARGIENPMNPTLFGRALRDKQHTAHKDSKGVRWRKGIRLRTSGMFGAEDAPDARSASPAAAAGSLPPIGAHDDKPAVDDSDDFVPGYE